MNQRSRSLCRSLRRVRSGFAAALGAAIVLCLPASAKEVNAQQPNWSATGSLGNGRFAPTATLLENGKVLIAGGRLCSNSSCTEFSSVELYDSETGSWSATGNLTVPRHAHVAVRLPNGKVLAAGGHSGATNWDSAELYDPNTGTWSVTGNLTTARAFATATVLPNGKVLVAGGGASDFLNTAELYDPATGSWTPTGTMSVARGFHTATLLADGRVLVASGASLTSGTLTLRLTAEIYDQATGSWTATGSLGTARVFHTETRLQNGKVLVTGGSDFTSTIYRSTELYDPATGEWSATGKLTTARISHTTTLLPNGKVLAAAGFNNEPVDFTQRSSELYNPETESWAPTADLNVVRGNHVATLLLNGKVLVSGGNGGGSPGLTSAELFDSTTALPQITGVFISGKKLFVQGQNFDEGAKLLLNDETQKTVNDELAPTTSLVCKKAGKFIGSGETVRLRVRNSDGTHSTEFIFTRASQ